MAITTAREKVKAAMESMTLTETERMEIQGRMEKTLTLKERVEIQNRIAAEARAKETQKAQGIKAAMEIMGVADQLMILASKTGVRVLKEVMDLMALAESVSERSAVQLRTEQLRRRFRG